MAKFSEEKSNGKLPVAAMGEREGKRAFNKCKCARKNTVRTQRHVIHCRGDLRWKQ